MNSKIGIAAIFQNHGEIYDLMREIGEVAGYMWQRGWSEKNAGNISVRLPDRICGEFLLDAIEQKLEYPKPLLGNLCFYITGTGTRMRDVAHSPADTGLFLQINEKGDGFFAIDINRKGIRPSSELSSHLGIHNLIKQRGTNETVVMHTHATELIVLTQWEKMQTCDDLNKILWGMHPETMVFVPKGVGLIPYMLPGSDMIADATINSFKEHDIVVWKKHGVFAIGTRVTDAFDSIDIVCKSAKIWMLCNSAGFNPEGLTEPQLDELRALAIDFTESYLHTSGTHN